MESDKNKKREKVVHAFWEYPELATQFLQDEKKARETIRKRAELGIKTNIPKDKNTDEKAVRKAEVV